MFLFCQTIVLLVIITPDTKTFYKTVEPNQLYSKGDKRRGHTQVKVYWGNKPKQNIQIMENGKITKV